MNEISAFLQELSIANQKSDAADDANDDDAADDDGATGVMIPMCHHCLAGDTEINRKYPPRYQRLMK